MRAIHEEAGAICPACHCRHGEPSRHGMEIKVCATCFAKPGGNLPKSRSGALYGDRTERLVIRRRQMEGEDEAK